MMIQEHRRFISMKRRCACCGHPRACHLGVDSGMCMYRNDQNTATCGCSRFAIQQETWIATLDPADGFDPSDTRTVVVRKHIPRSESDCAWAALVGDSGQIHGVGRTAREARSWALRATVIKWEEVTLPQKTPRPSRKQMEVALTAALNVLDPSPLGEIERHSTVVTLVRNALGRGAA